MILWRGNSGKRNYLQDRLKKAYKSLTLEGDLLNFVLVLVRNRLLPGAYSRSIANLEILLYYFQLHLMSVLPAEGDYTSKIS